MMGGASVSRIGKTFEAAFEAIKESIVKAPAFMEPDSDVVVMQPNTKTVRVFRVGYRTISGNLQEHVFTEIPQNEARDVGLPVTVAGIYGPKPKDNEWIGIVHMG